MRAKIKRLITNPLFILIILLIVAMFLRLYRIDVLMRFLWDESRDMLAIRNIIANKDITLFGPFNEIGGTKDFFGVFHYYLMLPSLWIANFNPIGPAIFTAILGTSSVGLFYYWISRWEKKSFALAVSAILAVSPLVVRFNKWPWNPNTIGFFAALYLISLFNYRKSKNYVWIFLSGLFLGLLFQLHYFTISLVASLLPILFLENRKTNLKLLLVFSLSFILPNLTFVIFDMTHQGFYRKILLDSFVGNGKQNFVSFSYVHIFSNPIKYLLDVSQKLLGSSVLGLALLLIWFKYAYDKLKLFILKRKSIEETQLILSWILFFPLTIFLNSLVDDYHSSALWVSFALSIVYALQKISKKYWVYLLAPLLLFLIFMNNINREPAISENMPHLRSVAEIIIRDIDEHEYENVNVASFIDSDTRAIRFRYFFAQHGSEILGVDDYLRTEILYTISNESWNEIRHQPAWELSSFRESEVTEVWNDEGWIISRVER